METSTSVVSVKEMLTFGWTTFERRPWFFILSTFGLVIASAILNAIISAVFGSAGIGGLVSNVLGLVVSTLVSMGFISTYLRAHDNVYSVQFPDLWAPQPFLKFFGAYILQSIIILVGLVLLIVPGIIAMVVLSFTSYLVMDKHLGPIAAMQESVRLTSGERWNLLLLLCSIIFINIIGAICLLIGLLVTIPVSLLAITHAYRSLAMRNPAPQHA